VPCGPTDRRRGRQFRGAPVNPTLQGYTAAVLEAAGPGAALRTLAADLEAIEQLVLANATLRPP
jgi:hypothetical protein